MNNMIYLVIFLFFVTGLPLGGEPKLGTKVSPLFAKRFDAAAQMAREGRHEDAFTAYDNIFAPLSDPSEPRDISADFLAEVLLRKCYCLMDLKQYSKARELFEGSLKQTLLTKISPSRQHSFHFSYGCTLGALGEMGIMVDQLKRAVELAPPPGTKTDATRCWNKIMGFLEENGEWEKLEEICQEAHAYGQKNELYSLQGYAGDFAFYAFRAQGKIAEARTRAKGIIEFHEGCLTKAKLDPATKFAVQEMVKKWKKLLADLPE